MCGNYYYPSNKQSIFTFITAVSNNFLFKVVISLSSSESSSISNKSSDENNVILYIKCVCAWYFP